MIEIYTDGACSRNPGPGSWAAVITDGNKERLLSGGDKETTNNKMELIAVLSALQSLPDSVNVALYTDSKYVQLGITEWIHKWLINGWRTSDRKAVKNKELWQELWNECERHTVSWHWVKGHADNKGNIRADELARETLTRYL